MEFGLPDANGEKRSVEVMPDGSIRLKVGKKSFKLNQDGTIGIDLAAITKVGFDNIIDLEKYNISQADGRVMHIFKFRDGSEGEFTFNIHGKLEVFHVEGGCGMVISPNNEIIIRSKTSADEDQDFASPKA